MKKILLTLILLHRVWLNDPIVINSSKIFKMEKTFGCGSSTPGGKVPKFCTGIWFSDSIDHQLQVKESMQRILNLTKETNAKHE